MMSPFSTSTTGYQLIGKLTSLRQSNNAIPYGTSQQRWINNDVYIFERQFYNNVVLVAINKNDTSTYNITGLYTALPAGNYSDYLGALLGGIGLSVSSGSNNNNPAASMTLPAHSVSVWQSARGTPGPAVGSIGPTLAQPGVTVTIAFRVQHWYGLVQRNQRGHHILVEHAGHVYRPKCRQRSVSSAARQQLRDEGQHDPIHRTHCQTHPRNLYGK